MEPVDTVLGALLEASHIMPPDELSSAAAASAARLGATETVLYLVDPDQRVLVSLASAETAGGEVVEIDGTMAGRAFSTDETQEVANDGGFRVFAPLLDGTERLGVARYELDDLDEERRRALTHLTSLVAELIASKDRFTDLYRVAARQAEMSVAAEMQWQALPPRTFISPRVTLAGTVHPAYEVGGDAFDFATNGDQADLAILDSMGHGLRSSVLANVALGAYRSARRRGLDLAETYTAIDAAIRAVFDDVRFVTAIIGRLDLTTGTLRWVSAGHPAPLLVRRGHVVGPLDAAPSMPLGLGGEAVEVAEARLEQGDRVLLFTDGVVEAHAPGGEPFGEERLSGLLRRAQLDGVRPPETLRRLVQAVLDHHAHHLRDDATMLFVELGSPHG